MSKYLEFTLYKFTQKTKKYFVMSKMHGGKLGEIKWYGAWRQYALFPEPNTIFNPECLNDIIKFIGKLMEERSLLVKKE